MKVTIADVFFSIQAVFELFVLPTIKQFDSNHLLACWSLDLKGLIHWIFMFLSL